MSGRLFPIVGSGEWIETNVARPWPSRAVRADGGRDLSARPHSRYRGIAAHNQGCPKPKRRVRNPLTAAPADSWLARHDSLKGTHRLHLIGITPLRRQEDHVQSENGVIQLLVQVEGSITCSRGGSTSALGPHAPSLPAIHLLMEKRSASHAGGHNFPDSLATQSADRYTISLQRDDDASSLSASTAIPVRSVAPTAGNDRTDSNTSPWPATKAQGALVSTTLDFGEMPPKIEGVWGDSQGSAVTESPGSAYLKEIVPAGPLGLADRGSGHEPRPFRVWRPRHLRRESPELANLVFQRMLPMARFVNTRATRARPKSHHDPTMYPTNPAVTMLPVKYAPLSFCRAPISASSLAFSEGSSTGILLAVVRDAASMAKILMTVWPTEVKATAVHIRRIRPARQSVSMKPYIAQDRLGRNSNLHEGTPAYEQASAVVADPASPETKF